MTPRRSDVVVAAMLASRPIIESVLLRAGALAVDVPDVIQDALVIALVALDSGKLVTPEDERECYLAVRAYVMTTAWRLWLVVARRRARESPEGGAHDEGYDPRSWFEARSELRTMTIPDDVLPLLVALSQESDIAAVARSLGMKQPTAYDKIRRFKIAARSAANRHRRRR